MLSNPNHTIDELLAKFLAGEANEQETQQTLDWMAASPENERHFESFRTIWEKSREIGAGIVADENAAWERLRRRMEIKEKEETKEIKETEETFGHGKRVVIGNWWKRVAAILVIVLSGVVSLWIYRQWINVSPIELATNLETMKQALPDGSSITLNKASSVKYPGRFSGNKRRIELKGEAFFAVKPNPDQPFEVTVNELTVTVLGTSFNIREAENATEIIVESGLVRVSGQGQSVELKAGERISITKTKRPWEKETDTDKLYQYYRTRSFNCDHTPLWKLANVLSEAYDVQIEIRNDAIRNIPLTTVFEDQPLSEILSIIQQTLDISVTQKGNIIYLQ